MSNSSPIARTEFSVELVHISLISGGDAIIHNGREMTVCSKDISRCEFFGIKIFGDSYALGNKLVHRLKYNDPRK